jgi:hypothetical protein
VKTLKIKQQCDYDNKQWPFCSTVARWQQLKVLQQKLKRTLKGLELREKVYLQEFPGWLRLVSRFVRYQGLWKYGQMKSVSCLNHQLYHINWTPQLSRIFLAASLVFGINEVKLFAKYVRAFGNCGLSVLHARSYKVLNVSCVKGFKRPQILDPMKIMIYYQLKIDYVRSTGDSDKIKRKINK